MGILLVYVNQEKFAKDFENISKLFNAPKQEAPLARNASVNSENNSANQNNSESQSPGFSPQFSNQNTSPSQAPSGLNRVDNPQNNSSGGMANNARASNSNTPVWVRGLELISGDAHGMSPALIFNPAMAPLPNPAINHRHNTSSEQYNRAIAIEESESSSSSSAYNRVSDQLKFKAKTSINVQAQEHFRSGNKCEELRNVPVNELAQHFTDTGYGIFRSAQELHPGFSANRSTDGTYIHTSIRAVGESYREICQENRIRFEQSMLNGEGTPNNANLPGSSRLDMITTQPRTNTVFEVKTGGARVTEREALARLRNAPQDPPFKSI